MKPQYQYSLTFPTLSFPFYVNTPFPPALLTPHPIEPNWVQPCHYMQNGKGKCKLDVSSTEETREQNMP